MPVVEMDREGFPLLTMDSRLVADGELCDGLLPAGDLPRSQDQESGESTGRRVVVVRRPATHGPPQPRQQAHRRTGSTSQAGILQHSISHRMLHLHLNFLSKSYKIHQELSRLSLHISHDFDSSQPSLGSPGPRYELELEQVAARKPFRVPVAHTESKPNKKGEVTISIWKEFCRGELVYDDTAVEWEKLKRNCRYWTPLQTILGDVAKFIPCCVFWLLQFLLTFMNVCVPAVGIQIVYFHHLYVHMKIHQVGNERGLDPVFTGAVYQGPMIYSVRHFSCPYCRYKRQSKVLLRYFQSLSQEMRDMAVR